MKPGLALAAILLALTWASPCLSQSPEERILPPTETARPNDFFPYVLEFRTAAGSLLIIGVRHTGEPGDPQIARVAAEWAAFAPTLAFNEGGDPPARARAEEAVRHFGEPGFVRHLAWRDNVRAETFEPSYKDEIGALLTAFSAPQIKIFYALRYVPSHLRKQAPEALEVAVERLLSRTLVAAGLADEPLSAATLDDAVRQLLPDLADWRHATVAWTDPTRSGHFTNEIARHSMAFRDRHIFRVLTQAVSRGERVFAVIGGSHSIALEPALIAVLGSPYRRSIGDEGLD